MFYIRLLLSLYSVICSLSFSFVNGGELFHHLQREHRFNEERSRFYSAELLCALEHLHDLDVVYRSVFLSAQRLDVCLFLLLSK